MPHPLALRHANHTLLLKFLLADLLEADQMIKREDWDLVRGVNSYAPAGILHGPFDRLRSLIALYNPPFPDSQLQVVKLQQAISRGWQLAQNPANRDGFLRCFRKMTRLFEEMLSHYRNDENLLLFILGRQELFNATYGTSFVRCLFQQIFPGGLEETELYLISCYQKRGYLHLLEQISALIAQLEPSQP
jgi:hypothetical protein